jgi:hypothetical protein
VYLNLASAILRNAKNIREVIRLPNERLDSVRMDMLAASGAMVETDTPEDVTSLTLNDKKSQNSGNYQLDITLSP